MAPLIGFWDTVLDDLYRYGRGAGLCSFLKTYSRTPAFRYTFWMRAATHFGRRRRAVFGASYLICRWILEHYSFKFGYQIPHGADIGSGLYLGHFGPIIVNPAAKVGCNVNLAVGVTIGQTNRGSYAGCPTLGDRVWIGTNAIVVGGITIGEGALIAPGAFVNFDVPPNAVVLGNPGKIVAETGTEKYVENIRSSGNHR